MGLKCTFWIVSILMVLKDTRRDVIDKEKGVTEKRRGPRSLPRGTLNACREEKELAKIREEQSKGTTKPLNK